ncbi:zinc finger protein 518B [Conger conger]|uniref:zinc finger protein 518B n=1 Tax=Conger conger TaxID=82655 RepID=UPI002A5AF9C2|nr:zinc finger protein 518B [Conger conger]
MNPVSQHQNVFISFVEKTAKKINLEKSPALPKSNAILNRFSCDKCRFSSRDMDQFNKHALQHVEMTFSCSYCNHVSYTRGESQRHLVKHTGSFPFKCQFCPYGAVRNDYIVKHTQRVHKVFEYKASYRAAKRRLNLEQQSHSTKTHVYSSPLSTDTGLPTVSVVNKAPVSSDAVGKGNHSSSLSKVQVELLAPLNEPIQHDKPLTIAYSPEMNIPPGCFVELVEVKTVNGTKELELKLVSQQAAENESLAKNLEVQTGKVGVQNSRIGKPTFRCSVIPQENKVTHPEPRTVNQPVEKIDFSSVKTVLGLSRDRAPELKKHSKEAQEAVKEDTGEDVRGFRGKSTKEASWSVRPQMGNKSQSLGKLVSSFQPQSILSTEGTQNNATQQNVVRHTGPSTAYNIGKLPCRIVPKDNIICGNPSHPTSNSFTPRESTLSKGKCCPFVNAIPKKVAEDKGPCDAPATTELPVISSVFSISQGPGDIPGGIRWEQALNNNLGISHNGNISAPEQGNAKNILSTRPTSTLVDTYGGPKGGTSHKLTNKGNPSTNTESIKTGSPSLVSEALRSPLVGQTSLPQLSKISPCDLVKNPADAPAKQKSPKIVEDSVPVFIPQGAVLKISESNTSSLTLKLSAPASEMTGSWMPRPVLFSSLNGRNNSDMDHLGQNKVPKLSLKRRKSGAENKGLDEDWEQQRSQSQGRHGDAWKLAKHKKRKKHKKTSKVKSLSQVAKKTQRGTGRFWLIPLKEDQPVKCPGPDQPVVVLNHPKPQALKATTNIQTMLRGNKSFPNCALPTRERSVMWQTRTTRQTPDQTRRTLKMKLKKVHQNKYQIVGFVFRDSPTDTQVLAR